MTTVCRRPTHIDDQAAAKIAMHALDKIIASQKPKMLIWDTRAMCIRTVSIDTAYAERMRDKPTCLGTYDFETRVEHILDDLNAVWGLS